MYLARALQICVLFNYLSSCQIWFSTCYASSVMDTITLFLYSTYIPSELKPLSYNRNIHYIAPLVAVGAPERFAG
jgi:hypothetical protein